MSGVVIAIAVFLILLGALVGIRTRTKNKFEVKTPDIVLALIPIALWLFMTGKIKSLAFGELKMESAFIQASQQDVTAEVSELPPLPLEEIPTGAKGRPSEIPELLRRRTRALSFQLNYGGYAGPAIAQYFEVLTTQPYLEYLLINEQDGAFFGLADARQIAASIGSGRLNPYELARWLNSGDKARLTDTLPGFVGRKDALKAKTERREALSRMDSLDVDTLPVVEEDGKFSGIVQRSRLTASMLIDIADRLLPGAGRSIP